MTVCPLCEARFELVQEGRQDFPPDWNLYVVHDHEQEPPIWRCSVFHRSKGSRYPEEAKAISQAQALNRRTLIQQRKDSKHTMSTNRVV